MKHKGDQLIDEVSAYQKVFETEQGKMVLYDILRKGNFLSSTLGVSPEDTARKEGRRELALYILEMVQKDMEGAIAFIEQQKEQNRRYNA